MTCLNGLFVAAIGCTNSPTFNCQDSEDCSSSGQCEPSGFCSFPDSECPSGRRYGDLAGVGLANECVIPGGDGTGSATSTTTTGGTSDAQTSDTTTTIGTTSGSESGAQGSATG